MTELIDEDDLLPQEDDDDLLARDIDGRLIRFDKPAAEMYDRKVTLLIDGKPVEIQEAVEARDSQGNPILDQEGRPTLRWTTIYDAAFKLFTEERKEPNPIP